MELGKYHYPMEMDKSWSSLVEGDEQPYRPRGKSS